MNFAERLLVFIFASDVEWLAKEFTTYVKHLKFDAAAGIEKSELYFGP